MCIRDSTILNSRRETYLLCTTDWLTFNIYIQSMDFGNIICCLLYTSDAADERSSVDLGGRRIIKKQKIVDRALLRMKIEKMTCTACE